MFNIYVEFEKGKLIDCDQIDSVIKIDEHSVKVTLLCGKTIVVNEPLEELQKDVAFYLSKKINK